MSISRTFVIAGGLCAQSLLGCVLDEPLDPLEAPPLLDRDGVVASVCSTRAHIARNDLEPTCDPVGAWVGEQLFDTGTPWLASLDAAPVPGALGHYCRYTWGGPEAPTPLQIENLYGHFGSEAISPSCLAMEGQGDVLTTTLGPTLRDIFHVGTGRLSSAQLVAPTPASPDPAVTVLVVDSQSSFLGIQPESEHGRHMGNIIGDIACPDDAPDCGVELEYVVGLPRVAGGVAQYVKGGVVGTHPDLAVAIYEGLRRWEQANASRPTPSHLVINLSVGWEPSVFGGTEEYPPVAIESLRSVLELAACKGVLVVTSAGNEGDYCDTSGPLLPGGWEARPAPDPDRCAELGVTLTEPLPGDYTPLVHAVGGLGIELGPMPNARAAANPRLLAASSHVVAGDPLQGGLTGTSVGTAVTSAAAALVWRYRTDLTAHEVMDRVYANAVELTDMTTDFALTGTTPAAPKRVDACAALDAACAEAGASCPTMTLGCLTSVAPPMSQLSVDLATLTPMATGGSGVLHVDDSCVDSCGNPVEINVKEGRTAYCATLEIDPAEHLINPTPDSIGCPTCGIQAGVLSLAVHPDYASAVITSVLVTLTDEQGNERRSDLGPLVLSSTDYSSYTLSASQLPPGVVRSGEITIAFQNMRTTTDALLVL